MTATEPYVVTTERFIPGPVYLDQVTTNTFSVGGAPVTGFNAPSGVQVGQVPVFTGPGAGSYQSVVDAGPWVFDVRTFGAKGDGQVVTDGAISSVTNTNVLTCATSKPFKPTDVGKAIMVKNALTSGTTTLVTTITGYTSSSVVTLGASATATVASGGMVMWATDDTVAIQNCINAAFAYGQVTGTGIIYVPPSGKGLFYGIAGPLIAGGATKANGQLVIPIQLDNGSTTGVKVVLVFQGVTDGGATRHWHQTIPQMSGSTLVSFGAFANATAQTNAINANGAPACISGQTGANGYGVDSLLYNNVLVRMQGMQVYTTHSLNGWGYGALNFHGLAAAALRDFGYGTVGTYVSGDFGNPNGFSAGLSIGVLMPSAGNNDCNQMENVVCHGGYTRGIFLTEHTEWFGGTMLYCWSGICPVGNYGDGGSGVGASHGVHFDQISVEGCNNQLEIIGQGQSGVGPMISGSYDTEGQSTIWDNASGLAAACGVLHVKSNGVAASPTVRSGTPLQIVCDFQFPGLVASPPALTINTAIQNPYGRFANVTLQGGVGITSVQLGQLMGGSSAPTMQTVVSQGAAVLPLVTVRVPPLGWIQVNGATTVSENIWFLE